MQTQRALTRGERKLADQFAIGTRQYSEAVVKLVLLLGTVPEAECQEQYAVVRKAGQQAEDTRAAFEQRVLAHRFFGIRQAQSA